MSFKNKGDRVFLLGGGRDNSIGGSEYLEVMYGLVKGKPGIDLDREKQVQQCCLQAIEQGIVKSAHDCADGGLVVAVAECCISGEVGLSGEGWCADDRLDVALFGEQQGRIIISVAPDAVTEIEGLVRKYHVSLNYLGQVGGEQLSLGEYVRLPVAEMAKAWRREF
jgi:phosphoribosylformylglycinamidine synthase